MRSSHVLSAAFAALTIALAPAFAQEADPNSSQDAGRESEAAPETEELEVEIEDGANGASQTLDVESDESTAGEGAGQEGDVEVEDSAILPSAEDHRGSEAPTMALDCENNPEDCEDPLTGAAEGPALSSPGETGAPQDDGSATEGVTAKP